MPGQNDIPRPLPTPKCPLFNIINRVPTGYLWDNNHPNNS